MEFADVILYMLYFMFAIAVAVAIWSSVRIRCRSTRHEAKQNGINVRFLSTCMWIFVLAAAVIAKLISDGSMADTVIMMLFVLGVSSVIVVGWSMLKKR